MEKLTATLTIEILGKPPENVTSTLNSLVDKMNGEKGVSVKNREIHEPMKVENTEDLFTAFAEVEVELDSIEVYFYLIFAYMPSHIELIHPEKIILKNQELNTFANVLTQRLHTYDGIAKNFLFERELFLKKLKEISPEIFKQITDFLQNKETKKD